VKPQPQTINQDHQRHSSFKRYSRSALRTNVLRFGRVAAIALMGSIALAQNASFSLENAFTALQKTPDWQAADLTYATAQRNLETAQAAAGINLSAGGSYSGLFPNSASSSNNVSVSVTASTNVLPWSPSYDTIRSAQRSVERAALDLRDTRNTLTLTTLSTYFGARTSALDVDVATASQKVYEGKLRVANLKYQNGQITLTDLLTAQQDLATAQSTLLTAQNALQINLANLGVSASTTFSTAPTELALPQGTVEAIARAGIERRADVQKAVSRVQDAEDALSNAQRDRILPNASVSLGYGQIGTSGLSSPSVSTSLNFQSGAASLTGSVPVTNNSSTTNGAGLSVSLSASIPVLAPSSDAKTSAAQTALDAARASLEATRRSAALDVAQKYSDATTAEAKIKVAQSTLETASKTLETATARNQSGLNTSLDLEQARVNVSQAQRDLESATASEQIAVYKLQNAIGSLNLIQEAK
jgi:outer membrane protein